MALLERTNFDSALIFSRTKHGADKIAVKLKSGRHSVAVMHSNRTQRERVEALEGFKSGKYEIMVATDIAARGIDIAGVSHVINYDVPEHPEDYVHRIGRTGRAQNVGDAFTLMNGEELASLHSIERFMGQKIPRLKLDGFPYLYTALFRTRIERRWEALHRRRPHPSRLFFSDDGEDSLSAFLELQDQTVNTKAFAGRRRTIVKNVSQMSAAARAKNFISFHSPSSSSLATTRFPSTNGLVKLGHPVPDSNFPSLAKSGALQPTQ